MARDLSSDRSMPAGFRVDRARAMARLVLSQTLGVRTDESVTIETWTDTLPWGNAFALEASRMGAHPLLLHRDDATFWNTVEKDGRGSTLAASPAFWAIIEKTDAFVNFLGPNDVRRDFERARKLGHEGTSEIHRLHSLAIRTGFRTASLYLGRVNPQVAAAFGLSATAWRDELLRATMVDPARMHALGVRLATALQKGRQLIIRHRNGTRLELRLKGRAPVVFGGVLDPTTRPGTSPPEFRPQHLQTPIPAGFVAVAVDEDYAEGTLVSNRAAELTGYSLDRASGGVWTFTGGRLVRAKFGRGQAGFDGVYASGGRGRDQPGLLSVGLNPKVRNLPWMVDQGLGVVAVGLGANRYLGGSSATSMNCNLHLAGADLTIDGRPVVRAGRIV
ncbi:MAG: hypothetical protein L3K15_08415 [Thermoplasmata archaeon]|nr:hypothetical protein [Thermoplasmata archaeon]